MRIATWNVERLCRQNRLAAILENCKQVDADILILTETDTRIQPEFPYAYHTLLLAEAVDGDYYRPTENRVSTERGPLLVYGTIFGIHGNRRPSFKQDILQQMADVRRLTDGSRALCIGGDFNCSFSDNYYFTNWSRQEILRTFADCDMELLTGAQPECIDHIAISRNFSRAEAAAVEEWNLDKKLSDHKGICIEI